MSAITEKIIAHKEGPVGWLIFNNPRRHNALSLDMWEAMPEILDEYATDPGIRVVVLKGMGEKAFISGADISQFEEQRTSKAAVAHYDAMSKRALQALDRLPKPTLAMIRGFCMGGGVAVALGCDMRIAASDACFAIPAARLGVGYAFNGVQKLVDLVGPANAKEIFFTARRFDADEAKVMGLVNRVLPPEGLETAMHLLTETIASNAPLTMKSAKIAVAAALDNNADRNIAAVQASIDACYASQDYIEGRRAFMEKRKPSFKGE